jgi:hypothetical protein
MTSVTWSAECSAQRSGRSSQRSTGWPSSQPLTLMRSTDICYGQRLLPSGSQPPGCSRHTALRLCA